MMLAALLILGVSITGCGPSPALVERFAERYPDALFYFETTDSLLALTLDDGPHPHLTPEVLGVLARYDATATFFLTGEKIPGNEDVVRRIVAEGHELGHHMQTATPSIRLSHKAFEQELRQAHVQLAVYDTIRWLRPASARYTPEMALEIEKMGYRIALGSVYPNDARNPLRCYQRRFILQHARPGAVIVLHEGMAHRRGVVQLLSHVLPALRRQGYRIVTLGELQRHVQAQNGISAKSR